MPDFIPAPDTLIIDEAFHKAAIDAPKRDIKFHLDWLINDRVDKIAFPLPYIDSINGDNELLIDISRRAHRSLEGLATRGSRSRISRDLFVSLSAAEADEAAKLEWRRKRETDREYPGMPIVHPGMPSERPSSPLTLGLNTTAP